MPQVTGQHCHAPDGRLLDVSHIRNHLKDTIDRQLGVPARPLVMEALGQAKMATAAMMPTSQSLYKQVTRYRRKNNIPNVPQSVDKIDIPEHFKVTLKKENFILHDDGAVEDRMIIFGTLSNLHMLNRADVIYADGTFDVTPLIFKQMYSIHGEICLNCFYHRLQTFFNV